MAKLMKAKSISVVNNRILLQTQKAIVAGSDVKLPDGTLVKFKFKKGRITSVTARNAHGKRLRTFNMKMSPASGGSPIVALRPEYCLSCFDDPDVGACYCYPIPCSWLGL